MPFADVVPVPLRNVHRHVTFDHCLASKPRIQLEIRRLLHPVDFVVLDLRQVAHTLFHYYVASGARTTPAAGMLKVKTEVHGYIEQGARFSVSFIRQLVRFEFKSFIGGKKSYLGHSPDCSGPHIIAK